MKKSYWGWAGGTLLVLLSAPVLSADPDDVDPPIQKLYARWEKHSYRVNGARLQITASIEDTKRGAELRLNWSIDYDGPRPPLNILKPSLGPTFGRTIVQIHAEGKGQKLIRYDIENSLIRGIPLSTETAFCTATKDKPATGTLAIPVAKFRDYFQKKTPDLFGDKPPVLHIILMHEPHARGENLSLDAWTGQLFSPITKVVLRSW